MTEPVVAQQLMELVQARPMCCCMEGQACQLVLVTSGGASAVCKSQNLNLGISRSWGRQNQDCDHHMFAFLAVPRWQSEFAVVCCCCHLSAVFRQLCAF